MDDEEEEEGATGGDAGGSGDAARGTGLRKAAAAHKKQRTKGPEGAKGHAWRPAWLETHSWLRTCPAMSKQEWEARPKEAPDYIFCVACAMYPLLGHNDVLAKKKKTAPCGRTR